MKKLFLTSVATLVLATGAHADPVSPSPQWLSPNFVYDCPRDRLEIFFDDEGYENTYRSDRNNDERAHITIWKFDKAARVRLEKELREAKKCDQYYQCLDDRAAGKVKHCYANDKRWRGIGVDGL